RRSLKGGRIGRAVEADGLHREGGEQENDGERVAPIFHFERFNFPPPNRRHAAVTIAPSNTRLRTPGSGTLHTFESGAGCALPGHTPSAKGGGQKGGPMPGFSPGPDRPPPAVPGVGTCDIHVIRVGERAASAKPEPATR